MRDSFRHALLPEAVNGTRVVPWFRGIEADGVPVGFIMIAVATEASPFPYLWRLLIDRVHQRRGIGKRVMAMLIDDQRKQGQSRLETSWLKDPEARRRSTAAWGSSRRAMSSTTRSRPRSTSELHVLPTPATTRYHD